MTEPFLNDRSNPCRSAVQFDVPERERDDQRFTFGQMLPSVISVAGRIYHQDPLDLPPSDGG